MQRVTLKEQPNAISWVGPNLFVAFGTDYCMVNTKSEVVEIKAFNEIAGSFGAASGYMDILSRTQSRVVPLAKDTVAISRDGMVI